MALPEVSDNHRRFVVTLKRGILFADDPAFRGRPRELVAADYVYSLKRFYDPAIITEHLHTYENAKLLGLSELRRRVIASKTPFPYDVEVPGIRALDRYRFEVRLAEPTGHAGHGGRLAGAPGVDRLGAGACSHAGAGRAGALADRPP